MRIAPDELDPGIVKLLGRDALPRRWSVADEALLALPLGGSVTAGILGSIASSVQDAGALYIVAWLCVAAWGALRLWRHLRQPAGPGLDGAAMRALGASPELSPRQRAYCSAVATIMDTPDDVDAVALRQVLGHLNALAGSAARIESHTDRVRDAIGNGRAVALIDERERLEHRLASVTDTVARDALGRSLSVCEERIATLAALGAALERLDAQHEVIVQTTSSVSDSLQRLLLAEASAAPDDLEEAQRRLREIGLQAQAVESAVEEVVTQRVG